MDTILSIVTGFGLRLFLGGLEEPLGRTSPALLGLWEGAVVHHLSSDPQSFDHYLAYGLRIVVDLFFTQSISRMVVVLLWTALGMVASEAVNPTPLKGSKRRHRSNRSRSVPTHIRVYQPPATPQPQLQPNPQTSTPLNFPPRDLTQPIRMTLPSRPPSPPSFFLEGESETNSNSPKPRYLQSVFAGEASASNSPSPKYVLLPTPPSTLVSEGRDVLEDTTHPPRRLSPIHEVSSIENFNPDESDPKVDHLSIPGRYNGYERSVASHAPSIATAAPLPVPNSTIRYIQTNWAQQSLLLEDEDEDSDGIYAPSVTTAAPLPVPNASTRYNQVAEGPPTPSEPDELRTPNATKWDLTDNDELRTPFAPPRRELSPLFSDQQLPPDFGATKVVPPAVETIIVEAPPMPVPITIPPVVSGSVDVKPTLPVAEAAVAAAPPNPVAASTVEYLSQTIEDPIPDVDKLSETESLQTETDATSVMSVISTRIPTKLSSRAELLRVKAREEEKARLRLKTELQVASNEARIRDALFLRADIRESEVRARKLHESAARRFFMGRFIRYSFYEFISTNNNIMNAMQQTTSPEGRKRLMFMDYVSLKRSI
jgi:hypothetical protein